MKFVMIIKIVFPKGASLKFILTIIKHLFLTELHTAIKKQSRLAGFVSNYFNP